MPDSLDDRPTRQPASNELAAGLMVREFRLEEPIGHVNDDPIWKAWDPSNERHVELRFLPRGLAGHGDIRDRLRKWFNRVERLRHESICPIHDLDEDPRHGLYLVSQYLDGASLRQHVAGMGDGVAIEARQVVELLAPVADALDAAHQRGIVHGDVRPETIFVLADGSVQVAEFGLATELRHCLARLGQTSSAAGDAFLYMAPEQWQARDCDGKTDQYALGVVAYELLAGRPPFRGDLAILRLAVLQDEPADIVGLPSPINTALFRALAKKPKERFGSCSDFISAVQISAPASDMMDTVVRDVMRIMEDVEELGEADQLRFFRAESEKLAQAAENNPGDANAFINWGNSIFDEAAISSGEERLRLYRLAAEKYARAVELNPDSNAAVYNLGHTLARQADGATGEELVRLCQQAGEKYAGAIRIKPDDHEAFYRYGEVLFKEAFAVGGDEKRRLLKLAGEKYRQSLEFRPDDPQAYFRWGYVLYEDAFLTAGDERKSLMQLSAEKSARALAHHPDMKDALYNCGLALYDAATLSSGDERGKLLQQAGERFARLAEIGPDEAVYNEWGRVLLQQARLAGPDEKRRFYRLACEKFSRAIEIKPRFHVGHYNWGITLADEAGITTGDAQRQLFRLACEKYAQTVEINPEYSNALYNWGIALRAVAKHATGKEQNWLLKDAREKFLQAERLDPGSAAFELGAIEARMGDPEECRKWFIVARRANRLPYREQVDGDDHLDAVRHFAWFQDIVAACPKQGS